MKRRIVVFSPEAHDDLIALYDWITSAASPDIALSYIERLEEFCKMMKTASLRGHARDDIREGLRIIGFEKRVTIAFCVDDRCVTILRLFYSGQNWEDVMDRP